MNNNKNDYRDIVKATSLFGGVQFFQILIQIFRSKFLAVLLGPEGMGIQGLLTTTTGLLAGLSSFGLGTSAVKNIAEANSSAHDHRIAEIIAVLRKWVWVTGLFGMIATLLLSPWLSELTFGNRSYTIAFAWISVTLLFGQLSSGQLAILQGLRKINYLANANLSGAVLGLMVSIPLYYYYDIDGIVPAIIISSVISLIRSWYFARKVNIIKVPVTTQKAITEGKGMLKMGLTLSLSSLSALGVSYLVRIYIGNTGSVADVGLYTAGFAIISAYVGLVFKAMGTDYYPRLSGVAQDNDKSTKLINQQAEIAILILGPILTVFLILINWIVIVLYSSKFVGINGMIHYAALGIYFKAVSWAIAFVFITKGSSRIFFWNELLANIYMLILNLSGYYFFGLDGLGVSFLVGYLFYLVQVFFIAKSRYRFSFTREFYKIFIPQLALGILCFSCMKLIPQPWAYIAGALLIGLTTWHSFQELEKRIELRSLIIDRIRNIRKRRL